MCCQTVVQRQTAFENWPEHIDVPVEDVITFGDGLNDIEMLSEFGYSVAMENGHERAKEVASMITGHVDNDGLADAMKKLKLI